MKLIVLSMLVMASLVASTPTAVMDENIPEVDVGALTLNDVEDPLSFEDVVLDTEESKKKGKKSCYRKKIWGHKCSVCCSQKADDEDMTAADNAAPGLEEALGICINVRVFGRKCKACCRI